MRLYFKLAWRNLWRNRRRTIIELTSIAGSVLLALAYNNLAKGSYAQMIEEAVKMGSGHIGIYADDYLTERRTEQLLQPNKQLNALARIEGVVGVYPRLYVPGLVRSSRGNRPGAVMGVDPERAAAGNPLFRKQAYVAGAPLSTEPPSGRYIPAVIGVKLADELGLQLQRKFVWMAQDINGQMISRLMRVVGIVQTGVSEIDQATVVADRALIGAAIGRPGAAHEIALMLPDQDGIDRVLPAVRTVAADIPQAAAYPWKDAMPALANAIRMDYAGLKLIIGFIYCLVGIGTINTMLMSVMEREREFGVVRSLGLRPAGIRWMIVTEATVLSVIGVSIGGIAAVGLGIYLARVGIDMSAMFGETGVEFAGALMDPVMYSTWDIPGMFLFAAIMVAIAVVAALYPAHRALKIRPADAMRHY